MKNCCLCFINQFRHKTSHVVSFTKVLLLFCSCVTFFSSSLDLHLSIFLNTLKFYSINSATPAPGNLRIVKSSLQRKTKRTTVITDRIIMTQVSGTHYRSSFVFPRRHGEATSGVLWKRFSIPVTITPCKMRFNSAT